MDLDINMINLILALVGFLVMFGYLGGIGINKPRGMSMKTWCGGYLAMAIVFDVLAVVGMVFGYAWFKVEPNDFIRLYGALRFAESDCDLNVLLVERETEEITDSVATRLVAPATAGALPPAWPGAPGGTGTDWSSMLMPVMMMGMFGMVMVSALKPEEEKEAVAIPAKEERKLLPPGRKE